MNLLNFQWLVNLVVIRLSFFSFGGGSRSSSKTTNYTKTQNGTVQGNEDITQLAVGDNITMNDLGLAEMSYDFAQNLVEQLANTEARALENAETVSRDAMAFAADYGKSSSERIIAQLSNYMGIALIVGVSF